MAERSAVDLSELAERYWQFLRFEFPLSAYLAGQANDDPIMFRESPEDHQRRATQADAMLAELRLIPLENLLGQDRITHRLLKRELRDLCKTYATDSHLRPWLLPAGPEFNTIYFANTTQIQRAEEAKLYVDRLQTLPRYFTDIRACLALGDERGIRHPRTVLSAALVNLRSAASGPVEQTAWFGPFKRAIVTKDAHFMEQQERASEIIGREILPTLSRLADFMEQVLMPKARDTVACTDTPLGAAFYSHWVRHFTTSEEWSPEAIHDLGLAEVARLEHEIAEVAEEAGFKGDVAGYRRYLREEPAFVSPTADALLERVQALAKRIDGKIPAIIGRVPRATYGVESIPASLAEKLPLAYAQPSPADASGPGVFWVSGLPDRVPGYLHVSLVLHEAWPGHLMHIALMQEMSTLPMFRRANFTKYSACLEGWAMYCEGLGEELKLYVTPHDRFGRLDMEMWRACRLVVDTGLHLKGWSRDQAIQYMVERLTLTKQAIEAEVDRYIAMPAQALGYMLGGLKFRELRQRAQERLGPKFKLRDYHDQLMAAGAVTLPVLEQVVHDWLDQRAA